MASARPAKKAAPRKTPAAKEPANDNARAFFIEHRPEWHDHFEFRLEHEGVLKSWAVPKGPPNGNDEAQLRLAVRTDDVPINGAPETKAGQEKETLWDSGVWTPASDPVQGFADGKLAFELRGGRIAGCFSLLRLRDDTGRKQGKENWLFRAERGRVS